MEGATTAPGRRSFSFVLPTLVAALFVYGYALPFLSTGQERLGIFWPLRYWLIVHVGAGMCALLTGPYYIWGNPRYLQQRIHRSIGIAYGIAVAAGSISALYLAAHTGYGWVFGMSMASMAFVWLVCTALAGTARRLHLAAQHREWMIRSYIVAFGFVIYQLLLEIFDLADLGTTVEQLSAAGWACWSVPLVIGESILQGQKMLAASARTRKVSRSSDRSLQPAEVIPGVKTGTA
jgi:hypothetical protein